MTGEALIDAVFDAARLEDEGADLDVRWIVGVVSLADVLLRSGDFTRERLLRGIERELRDAVRDIPQIRHEAKTRELN